MFLVNMLRFIGQYAEIYRASSTVVRPYETVTDAYPTYTNKPVKSASRYSSFVVEI